MNHIIEFVRADDPSVHTNNVEGNWWCVKRFLPSSGRYSLEKHLPVFMWHQLCNKRSKHPFWELLELIRSNNVLALVELQHSRESNEDEESAEDENPNAEHVKDLFCLFCDDKFNNEDTLIDHVNVCKNKF